VIISAGNGARALSTTEALGDTNFFKVANCKKVDLTNDEREFSLGDFSNYGNPIDLCAVGQNTDTLLSYSAHFCGMCACDLGALAHSEMGGTSAAAAHVTGVAALMLTANPKLRPPQIACLLRKTASKTGLDTRNNVPFVSATGISTVNCAFSGNRSLCYGAGLLDAQAAVKAALHFGPTDDCATEGR
jgi:subtilisin family serine protease